MYPESRPPIKGLMPSELEADHDILIPRISRPSARLRSPCNMRGMIMRNVFLALFVLALLAGPSMAAPLPDPEGTKAEDSSSNEDLVVGEAMC